MRSLLKKKKCIQVLSIVMLVCSMVFTAGCTEKTEDPTKTATVTTQMPNQTETGNPTNQTESVWDASLVSLRQALVETPQIFAAAYFGYVAEDPDMSVDPLEFVQATAPQLCGDLPFLMDFPEENIVGNSGFLFCIVPADENATVAVNQRQWNGATGTYGEPEVLYRSEKGEPILVLCSNDSRMPETEIVITDSKGNTVAWDPCLDSEYHAAPLYNDRGENLFFDFTSYEELPAPEWEQEIDASELIGSWELAWTEVEGDRNEVASGVCTIEITADRSDALWISYSDREFPDWNFSRRELFVTPGELYPGCGNHQWIAEVSETSTDTVRYALTLLEDGTLLLQHSWEMDGMPMVGYGWYTRMD